MAFDVDVFRAAHLPWSFTVDGRTFGARHVSAFAVQRYEQLRTAAKDHPKRQRFALWWLLRRAFPWRLSYLMRGDPVRLILGLEPAARNEALTDFFVSLQGKTAAIPLKPLTPTSQRTRGPRSSPPTPPPAA